MSEVESEMNGNRINNGVTPVIPSEMLPSEQVLEDEAKERQAEEEKRKNRDPPVVFTNIDVCYMIISRLAEFFWSTATSLPRNSL